MGAGHSHAHATTQNEKYLWMALALTSVFFIVEVIGGLITGSLAFLKPTRAPILKMVAITLRQSAGMNTTYMPTD